MSIADHTNTGKNLLLPPESFDYSGLPPDLVEDLRQQATRIRERVRITTVAIIEIGKDLLAAKQHFPGRFGEWIKAECGFTLRTAQNYMRAAKFAEAEGEIVSLLPPTIVYQLCAKGTPPELVDEVIDRAAA